MAGGGFSLNRAPQGNPAVSSRVALGRITSAQTINPAAGSYEDIILNVERFNVGGWGVNLTTGEITVPAGVRFVNMYFQMLGPTSTGGTVETDIRFQVNGALPSSEFPSYGLDALGSTLRTAGSLRGPSRTSLHMVPVSEGDVLKAQGGAVLLGDTFDIGADPRTWLYVEKSG